MALISPAVSDHCRIALCPRDQLNIYCVRRCCCAIGLCGSETPHNSPGNRPWNEATVTFAGSPRGAQVGAGIARSALHATTSSDCPSFA